MFYSRNTLSQKSCEAWKGQRGKKVKEAKEKKCDEKKQTNKQTKMYKENETAMLRFEPTPQLPPLWQVIS